MKACLNAGGICFTVIKFVELDQIFLLSATNLFLLGSTKTGGRKSIPLNYVKTWLLNQLPFESTYSLFGCCGCPVD